MQVTFLYPKAGGDYTYTCKMDAVPREGDFVFIHPLRYIESRGRKVKAVHWFAKPEHDSVEQVDVKVELS